MRGEGVKQELGVVQQNEFKTSQQLPLDLPNSALVCNKARGSKQTLVSNCKNSHLKSIDKLSESSEFRCNNTMISTNKLPDICTSSIEVNSDRKSSLIDELMSLEERRARYLTSSSPLDNFTAIRGTTAENLSSRMQDKCHEPMNEGDFWRNYAELSHALKGQHKFLMAKLEERKRDLLLVEAAWTQRDLRHAIERLLELYSQGLVFSTGQNSDSFRNRSNVRLGSLKSALVSDVIGILLLRPKLWSLDLCQLLLPVVVGDLLQQRVPGSEGHVEVALRAIRLTLVQLGPLITSTLESQKESARLSGGVDLSREERINKCLACFKLLAEARRQLLHTRLPGGINGPRLASLQHELEPLFKALGVDSCVKLQCQQSAQQRRTRARQSAT